MLDVIVYEDDNISLKKDIRLVRKILENTRISYDVYKYKDYINSSEVFKIFIVYIDNNKDLETAKIIRDRYFDSVIILVTCDNNSDIYNYHLMAFDHLVRNNDYENNLRNDLLEIIDKFGNEASFIFKYKRTIYRLPCGSINYIEKETNMKRCIIHTKNGNYYIVGTIANIFKKLNCKFIKTHQSCIVNVSNIKALDCGNNVIIFDNDDTTSLVNEVAKKKIKEWMNARDI